MNNSVTDRLNALGISLPESTPPAANYLPHKQVGNLVYISGQVSVEADGNVITGCLGRDLTVAEGQAAARICAINVLARIRDAVDGDFDRIEDLVRVTGFVSSAPDFYEHHLVINGASDVFVDVLGERGRHARAAIGMAALPLNSAVEVDAIFAVS